MDQKQSRNGGSNDHMRILIIIHDASLPDWSARCTIAAESRCVCTQPALHRMIAALDLQGSYE